jgi:lipopolysaccharide/colanic/teichoic acid biosynthesis glycosyltransferase
MLDMPDNMKQPAPASSEKNGTHSKIKSEIAFSSKDVIKSIADYTFATAALILFLPASVLIALAIKLSSRGSVLARQECLGRDNQVFDLFKFRTVTIEWTADARNRVYKGRERVTYIGRFLQQSGLDELPNLFNVLRGEMSIVGPRPQGPVHSVYYNPAGDYASRHRVKPGITGWAQIHGYAGEVERPQLMAEQLRYDLDYIEHRSFWLDLKIIALSLPYSLFRKRR